MRIINGDANWIKFLLDVGDGVADDYEDRVTLLEGLSVLEDLVDDVFGAITIPKLRPDDVDASLNSVNSSVYMGDIEASLDSLDGISTLSLEQDPVVRSQTMEFFATCHVIMKAVLAE
uniref:Uncharacterized protein n=1 Tax=Caenorhabditis japonica TaxID=281687 RepID=A0A8R1E7B1_CAEJA